MDLKVSDLLSPIAKKGAEKGLGAVDQAGQGIDNTKQDVDNYLKKCVPNTSDKAAQESSEYATNNPNFMTQNLGRPGFQATRAMNNPGWAMGRAGQAGQQATQSALQKTGEAAQEAERSIGNSVNQATQWVSSWFK